MARDRLSPDYVGGFSRLIFRTLLRLTASAVLANSASTAASIPRRRLTWVLHDPLPASYFADRPSRSDTVGCVGVVGRLAEWKGQRLFLQAVARSDVLWHARIVGGPAGSDAVSTDELVALAEQLGIRDRVEVLGHVDDVRAQLDRLDVLVHSSLIPEPFGQVVAEGLARGCLVVVPDQGGPSEIITSGRNGLTYSMGSVQSLAARLREAASLTGADLTRMRRAGRDTADSLAPDRIAEEFMERIALLCRA
jgi:glycosyltransferase involved in cell wall biosynthesis